MSAESERKYKNAEWLREQYVRQGKSMQDIADICNCTNPTILRWLRRYNIQTRSLSVDDERLDDEKWLREKYIIQDLTTGEIADICDCSKYTVSERLKEKGIKVWRGVTDSRLNDKQWLRDKYITEKKTSYEIADICDCSNSTVIYRLNQYNIEVHDAHPSGKSNALWKGGRLNYGSGWTKKKRQQVRELDNHRCVDCGMTQEDHQSEHGYKLHVHHLIKARDIDDAETRNAVDNLVTLCISCHNKWEKMSEAGIKPEIDRLN
jgi:DNA-binding CsgD family transcriptional regulator